MTDSNNNDGTNITQESLGAPPGPCAMVLFGAGGDLTKRKLLPAIYNLAKGKLLPEHFALIGVSIEKFSDEDFRKRMTDDMNQYAAELMDKSRGTGSCSGSTMCRAISRIRSSTRTCRRL